MNAYNLISVTRFASSREISITMVGWFIFLTCAAIYCLIYNQFVDVSPASFVNSLGWTIREYAVWLAVTPLLFFCLRKIHSKSNLALLRCYVLLFTTILVMALPLQLALSTDNKYESITANVVNLFPSQLSILSLLTALWLLFFHQENRRQSDARAECYSDKVRVMKGNREVLITWGKVDFISAAGNYMELTCAKEKYLLRITMKELQQQLPAQQFTRVHRSHIVNISAIRNVGSQAAGNGFVELRNDHLVPVSKGYKQILDNIQLVPDLSKLN